MTSLVYQLIIGIAVFVVGNAKPSRLPWNVDPHHVSDIKHNIPEFHADNGAFFNPDQEFLEDDPYRLARDHKKHKHHFNDDDDFSGWAEMEDDEDVLKANRIPTMSRDRNHFEGEYDIEFGPDDVIRDVSPHEKGKHGAYLILEEEHFGNELNDMDKIQELTRRMAQMQREMNRMKTLLESEYWLLRGRK